MARSGKKLLTWTILGLLVLLIGGGGVWYGWRLRELNAARSNLRSEYQQLMRDAVHEYYVLYGKLPESSDEVAFGNRTFRNPERINQAIKLEVDNYGSLEKCLLALEARALQDVLPLEPAEEERWQQESQAIQDLLDRAETTESKLRLLADGETDTRAGLRHAIELSERHEIPEEVLNNFINSAIEFRRLRLKLKSEAEEYLLQAGAISEDQLHGQRETDLAEARFEQSLAALLQAVDQESAKGKQSRE